MVKIDKQDEFLPYKTNLYPVRLKKIWHNGSVKNKEERNENNERSKTEEPG